MPKKTGKINEFFDKEIIDYLLQHYERLPKHDNGLRINANTMIEQDFNSKFNERISNYLSRYFGGLRIVHATIYEDYAPGGIHTDGYIDEPEHNMAYTFLVPLQSEYKENATIVFNETNDKAISYNKSTGLGDRGVSSYSQEMMPRGDNIGKEFIGNYLKHLDIDELPLSLDSVLYWEVGSALYWPRNKFHSSAWFPKDTKRKAMVMMTNE